MGRNSISGRKPRPPAGVGKSAAAKAFLDQAKNPLIDIGRTAQNVAPMVATTDAERRLQERWFRNPRRMDYQGVDTPPGVQPQRAGIPLDVYEAQRLAAKAQKIIAREEAKEAKQRSKKALKKEQAKVDKAERIAKASKPKGKQAEQPKVAMPTFTDVFGSAETVPSSEAEARRAEAMGLDAAIVERIRDDKTYDRVGMDVVYSEGVGAYGPRTSGYESAKIVEDRFDTGGVYEGSIVSLDESDTEVFADADEVFKDKDEWEVGQALSVDAGVATVPAPVGPDLSHMATESYSDVLARREQEQMEAARAKVVAAEPDDTLAAAPNTVREAFHAEYVRELEKAVRKDPEGYGFPKDPAAFAESTAAKMMPALAAGEANMSPTIRKVARHMAIPPTIQGLKQWLSSDTPLREATEPKVPEPSEFDKVVAAEAIIRQEEQARQAEREADAEEPLSTGGDSDAMFEQKRREAQARMAEAVEAEAKPKPGEVRRLAIRAETRGETVPYDLDTLVEAGVPETRIRRVLRADEPAKPPWDSWVEPNGTRVDVYLTDGAGYRRVETLNGEETVREYPVGDLLDAIEGRAEALALGTAEEAVRRADELFKENVAKLAAERHERVTRGLNPAELIPGEIILEQLGGNKFKAMTGATNAHADEDALTFKLPGNGFTKNGIRGVRIELTPDDLYTMTFYAADGGVVNTIEGVYADTLQSTFTGQTGLNTSLGTMGKATDDLPLLDTEAAIDTFRAEAVAKFTDEEIATLRGEGVADVSIDETLTMGTDEDWAAAGGEAALPGDTVLVKTDRGASPPTKGIISAVKNEGRLLEVTLEGHDFATRINASDVIQVSRMGEQESEPSVTVEAPQQLEPQTPTSLRDMILTREVLGRQSSAPQRFDANIAALKLLRELETDGDRAATAEEQAVLAKYSGFGDSAFSQAFPRDLSNAYTLRTFRENPGEWADRNRIDGAWRDRLVALHEVLTEEEFESVARSRLNAFYTTPDVIESMWGGLERLGVGSLKRPYVLEPSAGAGRFLGFEPTELADRSHRTAVELDSVTGRVTRKVYPNTEVHISGYEEAPLPNDGYDIAISNVPFGSYPVFDPDFRKGSRALIGKANIHNYFFGKTFDKLRPGGVLAFVTTHGTLDAPSAKPVREYLADRGDLLGAIRLPAGAFPDTEVVTDIIYMRKRAPGDVPGDRSWVDTAEVPLTYDTPNWLSNIPGEKSISDISVNRYFLDHPDMVLGTMDASGTMRAGYGEQLNVKLEDMDSLPVLLSEATAKLPENVVQPAENLDSIPRGAAALTDHSRREGEIFKSEDGTFKVKKNGAIVAAGIQSEDKPRVEALLGLRDAGRAAMKVQLEEGTESEVQAAITELNTQYDAFFKKYGPLGNRKNKNMIDGDPDAGFIRALERKPIVADDGTVEVLTTADDYKSAIFSGRVVRGLKPGVPTNASDALTLVKNEVGRLDFERMGELLGRPAADVERELSSDRIIFKNPVGGWEEASTYLSGDVRRKLREAEAAVKVNPQYNSNVEALRSVLPERLEAGQIKVSLGAPWVGADTVNDFLRHLSIKPKVFSKGRDPMYAYSEQHGRWQKIIDGKLSGGNSSMAESVWGTPQMKSYEIIEKMLDGKPIKVEKKLEKGSKEKAVDEEASLAAQVKAMAIQEEFQRWVWEDDIERTARLTDKYNDEFNNIRVRDFDGSHLSMPGMKEKWANQLHTHQKDAIWRVVQDRTALLAHEIGFRKTAVMVASAMELRRLGLSRKNVFVVPKATHAQFQEQFRDIYPGAKILFAEKSDLSTNNLSTFLNRIQTGDWDAVILSNEQFLRIPLKPETEKKQAMEAINELTAAISSGVENKITQKQLETKKEAMEVKVKQLNAAIEDRRKHPDNLYFEDMGIDQLYVDEADNFKNLSFTTTMGQVKGLNPNSQSQRAWDMYNKVNWLKTEGGGGGVVFATGTPISNTIAELWTMMRYLQKPLLEEKGMQHFDAWAKTFGLTTEALEVNPAGKYRMTPRFKTFTNLPELSNLWQMTADIRIAAEVPAMLALQPRLKGGKRTTVQVPSTPELRSYVLSLGERAANLKGKPEKGADNMLSISSDARKAALDLNMVDPSAPDNPQGKVAVAAANVAKIYRETSSEKGTQLIFLDLGTPKAKDAVNTEEDVKTDGSDEIETEEEAELLKNVYGKIRHNLVQQNGVRDEDIAFIHDAKTDKQRTDLFDKVRSGRVRILVGSTAKLGVGVNVQDRAAAVHHLDVPWKPRDIEQREGRIIRQGNKVYGPKLGDGNEILDPGEGVEVYNYVTEGSFDEFMWNAVEAKARGIKAMMKRGITLREMEDVDEFVLNASQAKALASGNPDTLRQVQLTNGLRLLEAAAATHKDNVSRARQALAIAPASLARMRKNIAAYEKDSRLVKATEDAPFNMTVGGKVFTERKDAGEALAKALKDVPPSLSEENKSEEIGTYRGFSIRGKNGYGGFSLAVVSPETGEQYGAFTAFDVTPAGVATRTDNMVKSVPASLAGAQNGVKDLETNIATYEKVASTPFERHAEIQAMARELLDIEARMKAL